MGGVKSYLRRIAKYLIANEHKVVILTQLTKNDQEEETIIEGIPVKRLDCGDLVDRIEKFSTTPIEERMILAEDLFNDNDLETTGLKLAGELAEFINKNKPQVIHFHNSYFISPYALYFLKQRLNTYTTPSFYFWTHSPPMDIILPDGKKDSIYSALSSFQNLFKGIFSVSHSVKDYLLKAGINSKVKYLGVNTEVFAKNEEKRKQVREKFGISESAFVVLYTGRIIKEKGLDLFPTIYQELLKKGDSYVKIQFLIVGEGRYKEELIEKLKQEKIDHNFHFTAAETEEDLAVLYSSADCFLLPTRREALGLSLLEAMSCSLPCLVTDLSGVKEIITHGKNGIIFPKDDTTEIVRWISALFSNKNMREDLAQQTRITITEKFSAEMHYRNFIRRLLT
ncbi:MAG: glycosyltransferase family 4 protein [Candidatus Heimdallarchaeota archaeon]